EHATAAAYGCASFDAAATEQDQPHALLGHVLGASRDAVDVHQLAEHRAAEALGQRDAVTDGGHATDAIHPCVRTELGQALAHVVERAAELGPHRVVVVVDVGHGRQAARSSERYQSSRLAPALASISRPCASSRTPPIRLSSSCALISTPAPK